MEMFDRLVQQSQREFNREIGFMSEKRAKHYWRMAIRITLVTIGLLLAGFVLLGTLPIQADLPAAGASIGSPGGGGLRRAFPEMNQQIGRAHV